MVNKYNASLIDGHGAKEWLFSYGTLQDPEMQRILFGYTCEGRNATLSGWSLFASDEDGYLFIGPDPAGQVAGCVIAVDASARGAADQWEEVPYYEREKVTVTLHDGREMEAWTYTRRVGKGRPYAGGQMSVADREAVLAEARSLADRMARQQSA